jgi:hypothetical protein
VSKKPAINEAAVIAFRNAAEFEAWLDAHVDLRLLLEATQEEQADGRLHNRDVRIAGRRDG